VPIPLKKFHKNLHDFLTFNVGNMPTEKQKNANEKSYLFQRQKQQRLIDEKSRRTEPVTGLM